MKLLPLLERDLVWRINHPKKVAKLAFSPINRQRGNSLVAGLARVAFGPSETLCASAPNRLCPLQRPGMAQKESADRVRRWSHSQRLA